MKYANDQLSKPRNWETLRTLPVTPLDQIPQILSAARAAQPSWAALSPKKRSQHLLNFKEAVLTHVDEIVELIHKENGKPHFEALAGDVLAAIEVVDFFATKGMRALRDQNICLGNPLVLHRQSYLNFWPVGVVAVISPWNFPFFLPIGEIAMALITGNTVVFKPSEVTPLVGLKIQELFEEAGLPTGVLQTLTGGAEQGAALIQSRPNKIFFTGSVPTGKKISEIASKLMIPVNLELGGKDPMIVLSDANLDYATSAALWGGFSNSGQFCASTERILVHESIHDSFVSKLKEKLPKLKGHLGFITYEKQKTVYERQIQEARDKNLDFFSGGNFNPERTQLEPTLVGGSGIEDAEIYKEETFGPVLAITKFRSIEEAVRKANDSPYGLLASIITNNIPLAEEIAKKLEYGSVLINEVGYTASLPETPWGGIKETGWGRKHSLMGLMDFVHVRHIHKPRFHFLKFKSFWWFPYTPFQYQTFRWYLETHRRSWLARLKAIPVLLWNFVQFLKNEKRT